MKKTLSIILVIVMLMALVPAAFAATATETTISLSPTSVTQGTDVIVTVSVVDASSNTPSSGTLSAICNGKTITLTEALNGATGTIDTTSMPAGDYTVTANYTGNSTYDDSTKNAILKVTEATKYTVSYDANGHGTAPEQVKDIIDGKSITLATMADVEGFEFAGWNDGTTDYAGGATYTVSGNVTMTAQWKEVCYVTFNANGGAGTMASQKVYKGTATNLTKNAFTKTGYKFTGWKDAGATSYTDEQSVTLSADIALNAQWAPITYTVNFHANGGTGTDYSQNFTYDAAQNLEANKFTRSGYTFLGWSTNAAATSATYADKESVANLTSSDGATVDLYAIWTPNTTTYTVTMGKYSGANLGRAYYSVDKTNWYEVTSTTGYTIPVSAGTTLYFKMDPYNGYYRHPYVVNANGSYYSPGYGQIFSVYVNENKTVKLNFSQYVPTGDAGVWGYVVTMLASSGTAAGVYFGTKKKK